MADAKLAYTFKEALDLVPWGRTKMRELVTSGELPSRFQHGHRYIMREDLVRLLIKVDPDVPIEDSAANAA